MSLVFLFLFSLVFVFPNQSYAQLGICKFSFFSTSDQVNICNNSNQQINLADYSIWDKAGNNKKLSKDKCFLPAQDYISINFSNYLNKLGDYILLKEGDNSIDCVGYGNVNCIEAGLQVEMEDNKCNQLSNNQWIIANNCDFSKENNCLVSVESSPVSSVASETDTTPPPPEFIITDSPPEIEKGKRFSIKFALKNGQPHTTYTLKVVDDRGDRACFVKTINNDTILHSNSSWDDFPQYTVGPDGEIEDVILAVIDDCSEKRLETGDYAQIRLKTKEDEKVKSLVAGIRITFPAPTLPPTRTPTPTSQPTNMPKPTPTVTVSITPTPSNLTPSPTQTSFPSPTPTDEFRPQVLGSATTEPTSTPKDPRQIIPIIFMITGGLFLATPAIVSKFKKK